MGQPASAPRDRRVIGLVAALAAGILLVSVVSGLVPGIDGALAALPIIVLLLVVGTAWVLARSLLTRDR